MRGYTGTRIAGPSGNMNGNQNKNSLDLGPGFSDSNFDLQVPSNFRSDDHTPSWSSPAVPAEPSTWGKIKALYE